VVAAAAAAAAVVVVTTMLIQLCRQYNHVKYRYPSQAKRRLTPEDSNASYSTICFWQQAET
jgi:hypothetical protein